MVVSMLILPQNPDICRADVKVILCTDMSSNICVGSVVLSGPDLASRHYSTQVDPLFRTTAAPPAPDVSAPVQSQAVSSANHSCVKPFVRGTNVTVVCCMHS